MCRDSRCAYHFFALKIARGDVSDIPDDIPLPEVRRTLLVNPPTMKSTNVSILRKSGTISSVVPVSSTSAKTAGARLARFLRLINHLGTAPWANKHFETNHRILLRLTAAHISLIAPGGDIQDLCHIIDPRLNLTGAGNLVWVTNRQQGKTTTLARFLAALSIASPVGGLLCTVYSTSLDRSQELVKAAKQYIYWLKDTGYPEFDLTVERDNERMYVVNNGAASNQVIARPKNPDSCRGEYVLFFIGCIVYRNLCCQRLHL